MDLKMTQLYAICKSYTLDSKTQIESKTLEEGNSDHWTTRVWSVQTHLQSDFFQLTVSLTCTVLLTHAQTHAV